jgi:hypothetical protein
MDTTEVAVRHNGEVDANSLARVPPAADAAAIGRRALPQPGTDGVVRVMTGHYGSGKTEVSVSLAMRLAAQGRTVVLGDLDVVNPYFRSRERAELMTAAGIRVISSSLGHNITLDLPAVSAEIRDPLGDPACDVIIDAGGDEAGARVLVGFVPDLLRRGAETLCVVNAYRPQTRDVDGVLYHLRSIEATSSLTVGGLVSNTHVCRETTVEDVVVGYRLTRAVSDATGIPIRYVCAVPSALAGLEDRLGGPVDGELLPIGLYLRDAWM